MKKLFKSNKQKPIVTPTPLPLPPDTPIHSQHQRAAPTRTVKPARSDSNDAGTASLDERWVVLPDSADRPRIPNNQSRASIISLLPNPSPPQNQPANFTPPPQHSHTHSHSVVTTPVSTPAQSKKKPASIFPWSEKSTDGHRDESETASNHSSETQNKIGAFFFGSRDKDKDREKEKERTLEREPDRHTPHRDNSQVKGQEPQWDVTRLLGYLTANASEDWALVLELCERASANEISAKEAARALRREFKYAEAPAQLSAARLWAIMLRNGSDIFVRQTASRKFLDALEDVLASQRTNPVVRERLLDVLASATYHFPGDDPRHGFPSLWRKVRPPGKPEAGVPFDPADAMFTPPAPRRAPAPRAVIPPAIVNIAPDAAIPQNPAPTPPPRKKREKDHNILLPGEEMSRVFTECEVVRGNAALLSDALAYARPADLEGNRGGVLREFHAKCLESQNRIVAQIPWATSMADKSRARADETIRKPKGPMDKPSPPQSNVGTMEEEMLATLLAANEALFEALRMYDDLQRVALAEYEERIVEERSRVETRLDRSQYQYMQDGSLQVPEDSTTSGPSRSPSPARSLPLAPLVDLPTPPSVRHSPLPPIPTTNTHGIPYTTYTQAQTLNNTLAFGFPSLPHANSNANSNSNSAHSLAPPPHAPHGPRHFHVSTRSRSPSPEPGAVQNMPQGLGLHGANPGVQPVVKPKSYSDHVLENVRHSVQQVRLDPSDSSADGEEDVEEIYVPPIRPSAKALGKRKAVEKIIDPDAFDPDELFKDPPTRVPTPVSSSDDDDLPKVKHKPTVYAYDAAAEREKDRLRLLAASPPVLEIRSNGIIH